MNNQVNHPFAATEVEVVEVTRTVKKKDGSTMKKVYEIVPADVLAQAETIETRSSAERQVLDEIMTALRQHKPIQIAYKNSNGEESTRFVDVGSVWRTKKDDLVFNGYDYRKREMRSFRADRVTAIGVSN